MSRETEARGRGLEAEKNMQFEAAFRRFSTEAELREIHAQQGSWPRESTSGVSDDTDMVARLWMRAARAREMSEPWRAEAGTWEWLGNFLGRALRDNAPDVTRARYEFAPERRAVARFYSISDSEWENPRQGDEGLYDDVHSQRLHRRAWAFTWAAAGARAHSQFNAAARLYRRAAVSWEKSRHDARHCRAASCYYEAAICAAQTGRFETRTMILQGWCPSCIREHRTEETCPRNNHSLREEHRGPEERIESDLERLIRCWSSIRQEGGGEEHRHLHEELDGHLAGIQRALAASGARDEAREFYRVRRAETRAYRARHRHPAAITDWASWALSFYGTRVWHFVASMIALYGLVIPTLWWASGAVAVAPTGRAASWVEALTFSLSGAITLWTGYFERGTWPMNLGLPLQALSGVFAVGYVLWMLQRPYDD